MDNVFKELDTLCAAQVALESANALPVDAQKLLALFAGGSAISNEADYENGQKTGPTLIARIKELVKRIVAWVGEKIQQAVTYVKQNRLALEQAEKEVESAVSLMRKTKEWQKDSIDLSASVVGALATDGTLDNHLVDKLVRARNVLEFLFGLRSRSVVLANKVFELAKAYRIRPETYEAEKRINTGINLASNAVVDEYFDIGREIQRYLTVPVRGAKEDQIHVPDDWPNDMRGSIKRMQSLPLPGGYVMSATLWEVQNKVGKNWQDDTRSTIKYLLDTLSLNLEKTPSTKTTFSGQALDSRSAQAVLDESQNILNEVKKGLDDKDYTDVLDEMKKQLLAFNSPAGMGDSYANVSRTVGLMAKTARFLEADQTATARWATRTVRAATRYVAASAVR